jgi:hypothetical protein
MALLALRPGKHRKSICCVRCSFSTSGKDGIHVDYQHIKAYIARATAYRTPKDILITFVYKPLKRSKQEQDAEHGDQGRKP